MTAGQWVVLDKEWSRAFLTDFAHIVRRSVPSLLRSAGLESREVNGTVALRTANLKESFVYIKPLQRSDGTLRRDARDALVTGVEPDEMDVRDVRGRDLPTLREMNLLAVTSENALQYELLINSDPIPLLRDQAKRGMRLYRVGSYDRFFNRTRVFEILEDLAKGIPHGEIRRGATRTTSMLLSGRWQILPASLVCFPLTARHQPLAAVVSTRSAAEIAILPPAGNIFERAAHLSSWPVGNVGASLLGPGTGVYRSDVKLMHADASALLRRCVRGANDMLRWFLDPAHWQTEDGTFDASERWIAWGSVLQAFEAIIAFAEHWNYSSAFWDAFRALGILQGVWQGTRKPKDVDPLREMLRPDRLREHAAKHIPNDTLRDWTMSLIQNWEAQLTSGFPGNDLERALLQVEDLRHLVHGTGAAASRRNDRLNVLRTLAEHEPSLQLLPDIAVMWWSAAFFSPSLVCQPGKEPWRS